MVDKLISCWLELEGLFYGVYSNEEGMNRNEHLQKQVHEIRYFIGHGFIRTVKFLESCPFRTRIILLGPRLSPPLLFELLDPQKGYNEYVVSKERNTNRKCIYDNLRV